MSKRDLPKRIISEIYSRTAQNFYEPIVVQGTFRLFARDLEKLVSEQGRVAIRLPTELRSSTCRSARGTSR